MWEHVIIHLIKFKQAYILNVVVVVVCFFLNYYLKLFLVSLEKANPLELFKVLHLTHSPVFSLGSVYRI